jgi:hypothetical protein
VDLAGGLTAAGFVAVEVHEKPEWDAAEHAVWTEAAGLDDALVVGDPALQSFHGEAMRSLATHDLRRRVMATATAPG